MTQQERERRKKRGGGEENIPDYLKELIKREIRKCEKQGFRNLMFKKELGKDNIRECDSKERKGGSAVTNEVYSVRWGMNWRGREGEKNKS